MGLFSVKDLDFLSNNAFGLRHVQSREHYIGDYISRGGVILGDAIPLSPVYKLIPFLPGKSDLRHDQVSPADYQALAPAQKELLASEFENRLEQSIRQSCLTGNMHAPEAQSCPHFVLIDDMTDIEPEANNLSEQHPLGKFGMQRIFVTKMRLLAAMPEKFLDIKDVGERVEKTTTYILGKVADKIKNMRHDYEVENGITPEPSQDQPNPSVAHRLEKQMDSIILQEPGVPGFEDFVASFQANLSEMSKLSPATTLKHAIKILNHDILVNNEPLQEVATHALNQAFSQFDSKDPASAKKLAKRIYDKEGSSSKVSKLLAARYGTQKPRPENAIELNDAKTNIAPSSCFSTRLDQKVATVGTRDIVQGAALDKVAVNLHRSLSKMAHLSPATALKHAIYIMKNDRLSDNSSIQEVARHAFNQAFDVLHERNPKRAQNLAARIYKKEGKQSAPGKLITERFGKDKAKTKPRTQAKASTVRRPGKPHIRLKAEKMS